MLDTGTAPLEKLQEKTTIGEDPYTGYLKSPWRPECVLGQKYGKKKGESTPPYYLACQRNDGDYFFTEDPTQINFAKYKERLKAALKPLLIVRGHSEDQINLLLGLVKKKSSRIKKK
jgi:hypothetical protein